MLSMYNFVQNSQTTYDRNSCRIFIRIFFSNDALEPGQLVKYPMVHVWIHTHAQVRNNVYDIGSLHALTVKYFMNMANDGIKPMRAMNTMNSCVFPSFWSKTDFKRCIL